MGLQEVLLGFVKQFLIDFQELLEALKSNNCIIAENASEIPARMPGKILVEAPDGIPAGIIGSIPRAILREILAEISKGIIEAIFFRNPWKNPISGEFSMGVLL